MTILSLLAGHNCLRTLLPSHCSRSRLRQRSKPLHAAHALQICIAEDLRRSGAAGSQYPLRMHHTTTLYQHPFQAHLLDATRNRGANTRAAQALSMKAQASGSNTAF